MNSMQTFTLWFLDNLPEFLMSEPIIYFVGILFLTLIIKIIISFRQ